MKKKFREIVIDNVTYAWRIRYYDTVVIYKDKKIIFEDNVQTFPITPKTVETIIRCFILSDSVKDLSDMDFIKTLYICPFLESGWCRNNYACRFKIEGTGKHNTGCELSL